MAEEPQNNQISQETLQKLVGLIKHFEFFSDQVEVNKVIFQGMKLILEKTTKIEERLSKIEEKLANGTPR